MQRILLRRWRRVARGTGLVRSSLCWFLPSYDHGLHGASRFCGASKIFNQRPQRFCHRPGLRNATAWMMRSVGIENLRYLSQAGLGEMNLESIQQPSGLPSRRGIPTEAFDPGRHQRSQEKRPDRALMIGAISFRHASFVAAMVARICW